MLPIDTDPPEKRARKEAKREREKKVEYEYQQLAKKIKALQTSEDTGDVQTKVAQYMKRAAELYPIIHKKLTGSALDARFMKTATQLSTTTAKKINSTARPFDLGRIIRSLKREHKDRLQKHVASEFAVDCFRIAPTFEFFYGAIKLDGLELKQRKKRPKIITAEDINVSSIKATERDMNTECDQDSTPKEVEMIFKKIKNLTTSGSARSLRLINTLVDPNSFTQTVENIFHTSFLVKEGRVGIKKDTNDRPILVYERSLPETNRDRPSNQSIFSFSMSDYNKWKSMLNQ